MEPCYQYRAELLRVIDGDTYVMRIDLGFHCTTTVHLRLRGFDAPERGTPSAEGYAERARKAMEGRLLVVQTYRDRRSFARWVGDVYADGVSVAETLAGA